jgi:hypothetical protein
MVVFWTFLVLRSVACLLSDDRIRVRVDKWMFNSDTPFVARKYAELVDILIIVLRKLLEDCLGKRHESIAATA